MRRRTAMAANSGKEGGGARGSSVGDAKIARQRSEGGTRSKRPPHPLAPGLYIVATPIGNARDISLRALDVFTAADIIACEDTRVTGKLLALHGVDARRTPYHEFNAARVRPKLLERITRGEAVVLATDAGTPLISDPGYKLVSDAIDAGLTVTTVPGASAPVAALTVSGLPTDRFLFAGFLPPRRGARRKALAEFATVPATLVLFESPRRLAASLADMAAVLGPRPAAVTRELTKRFEEQRRGSLAELADHYREHGGPKGEVVVVIGPPASGTPDDAHVDNLLRDALEKQSVRDAVAEVAAATGVPRKRVYARALELSGHK